MGFQLVKMAGSRVQGFAADATALNSKPSALVGLRTEFLDATVQPSRGPNAEPSASCP